MKSRKTITLIAAVAATLAAGTAISVGQGGPSSGPGAATAGPGPLSAKAQPVSAPSNPVAARAAGRRKVSIAYFESKAIDLGNGTAGGGNLYFKFKGNACPKGSKAVDGYMFYAGKEVPPSYVVPAGDAPRGTRNWQFWLNNPNTEDVDEGVKFGIICAKRVS